MTIPKKYHNTGSTWLLLLLRFVLIITLVVEAKGCQVRAGFIISSSSTTTPSRVPSFFLSRSTSSHQQHQHQQQKQQLIPCRRRSYSSGSGGSSSMSNIANQETNEVQQTKKPFATIVGYISSDEEENELKRVLVMAGYQYISSRSHSNDNNDSSNNDIIYSYKYVKASGMLKLIENVSYVGTPPKWVPVQSGEENVLVANGWSFLDSDESEPMSAFDIDAANKEGQYVPKWGGNGIDNNDIDDDEFVLSSLGFDLKPMSKEEILSDVEKFLSSSPTTTTTSQSVPSSKLVLLEGGTDTPHIKITNNGFDFSGSVKKEDIEKGLFVCAIGGLPLFTTADLSPTTASSGWLTFVNPVANDHVDLVYPEKDALDQRIEVICARSRCHLGHYFGKGEGYCINTSALNFIPYDRAITTTTEWNERTHPLSWHNLIVSSEIKISPTKEILRQSILNNISLQKISLGAGCFWHVEFALRRLPGVVDTAVGYSGGVTPSPSYKDVCSGDTKHAEVVMCNFDPKVLDPQKLLDCFLAMHDPTSVRSHGKRARETGQYRSCIIVYDKEMELLVTSVVRDCTKQLAKVVSTEILHLLNSSFWIAESRHQRHDERVKNKSDADAKTLPLSGWLLEYGRRSSSIWGSSETFSVDDDTDDGMARMMI